MKVLFLSQIVPYPPHGGVLQRGFNLIREISREHEVHLMAFVHPDTLPTPETLDESRSVLERYCSTVRYYALWPKRSPVHKFAAFLAATVYPAPFSVLAHRSAKFRADIVSLVGDLGIDLVHFDTIGLASYRDAVPALPAVLTHHNMESTLMARRAAVEKSAFRRWYVRRQSRLLEKFERRQSHRFDCNLMVSEVDREELLNAAPGVPTDLIPNGVDIDYFQPGGQKPEAAIVYTGGMNMFANADAVLYLLREIWPNIKSAVSNVRFYVIGQNPTEEILAIAGSDPSVIVTGYVEDIRPYVARAAVYVVPIRVGGGTKLKVLDALAQGKAIVSTTVGCEGIDVSDGVNVSIADEPGEFADNVVRLLQSAVRRKSLETCARQLAEQKYSWQMIGRQLSNAYRRALSVNG